MKDFVVVCKRCGGRTIVLVNFRMKRVRLKCVTCGTIEVLVELETE